MESGQNSLQRYIWLYFLIIIIRNVLSNDSSSLFVSWVKRLTRLLKVMGSNLANVILKMRRGAGVQTRLGPIYANFHKPSRRTSKHHLFPVGIPRDYFDNLKFQRGMARKTNLNRIECPGALRKSRLIMRLSNR